MSDQRKGGGKPSFNGKPRASKPSFGDKPRGGKPAFDKKPRGEKPSFDDKPRGEKRPFRDKPKEGKPSFGDKPRGSRDGGDRHSRSFDKDKDFDRKNSRDAKPYGKGHERSGEGPKGEFKPRFDKGERTFERRGDQKFDRSNRDDRKAYRSESFKARDDKPRAHEDRPKKDGFKYGSTPKEQARKGYQGRKQRDDGHAASPARLAALKVVGEFRTREAFAQDLIAKHIDRSSMSAEDRAFATKLVLGVVSTYGALDLILNRCMNNPDDVSEGVRDALRISVYEIIFLKKGPHAAVDQGVELVRSVAPRASGVGNAILRKLVTIKDEFPFGDPQREMSAYALEHAFPEWLARELVSIMGADEAHVFMETCNEPAPVFVALNAAKEGEAEVLQTLEAAHGNPQAAGLGDAPVPGCYKLETGQVLTDGRIKRYINNGHLLVSDLASQSVANAILPETKPASMLEIGAGRATKTILIQSNAVRRWGSQIKRYVTLDNHEFKTKLLVERTQAYGIEVADALTGDATDLSAAVGEESFDCIFIDAPCTGLGTLRRHPEIRWRLKPETIDEYASLGLSMLKQAAAHVAPGGTLAYATCTITSKENASVVKAFLESPEGASFKLLPIEGNAALASQLVSGGSDAHFAVKMIRLS